MMASEAVLRDVLAKSDTVVFVGSGVSLWSGLPSWGGLIDDLVNYLKQLGRDHVAVERELANGDLLLAASLAMHQLTTNERAEFLRGRFLARDREPSELHRRVAAVGPTCFITTNYDQLLERALADLLEGPKFEVVTPNDIVETATIIRAHARDFVFKPHGDIGSVDTIILTREDYRQFQGRLRRIAGAMRTLLLSRPVVFIGFGLRDPDFLLLKDTLSETYDGAAQDHYAIVPDVTATEVTYWRDSYGLHLVPYETDNDAEKADDRHRALLALLDRVTPSSRRTSRAKAPQIPSIEPMAMLRHARLTRAIGAGDPEERFPVRASPTRLDGYEPWMRAFVNIDAAEALRRTNRTLIVTGQPGAGKSVAARQVASQLAEQLEDAVLAEVQDIDSWVVPIYVDLKGYEGDLAGLVSESVSAGLDHAQLAAELAIVYILDGANEVPYEEIENNRFPEDLDAFIDQIEEDSRALIVTRTAIGLEDLDLPAVEIDSIDEAWVRERLTEHGLTEHQQTIELVSLLSRPLFFRLFEAGAFRTEVGSPHQVYREFLARLETRLAEELGVTVELGVAFGQLAFQLVGAGEQLIDVTSMIDALDVASDGAVEPSAVLTWLVTEDVLLPVHGNRVLFFHHSITEYLAAMHLASIDDAEGNLVRECLKRRQWDHAVLLSLGFLDPADQERNVEMIVRADPVVALRALSFLDDPERWTGAVLEQIVEIEPTTWNDNFEISDALGNVVFRSADEPVLRRLVARNDLIGGAAFAAIVETVESPEIVYEAIDLLTDPRTDWNFNNPVQAAVTRLISEDPNLIERLLSRLGAIDLDSLSTHERDKVTFFVGSALSGCSSDDLLAAVAPIAEAARLVQEAVLSCLRDIREVTVESVQAVVELLPICHNDAVFCLSGMLRYGDYVPDGIADRFPPAVVGPAIQGGDDESRWDIGLLSELSRLSAAWAEWTLARAAEATSQVERAALLVAVGEDDEAAAALSAWVGGDATVTSVDIEAIDSLPYTFWRGRSELVSRMVKRRDGELAYAVVNSASLSNETYDVGRARIAKKEFGWWLDWLAELLENEQELAGDQISLYLSWHFTRRDRARLFDAFRTGEDRVRRAQSDLLFPRLGFLRLDDLEGDVMDWLLEDAKMRRSQAFGMHDRTLLGGLATEEFMENVVLPALARPANEMHRENLVEIAIQAGDRHGRRYVSTTGELLI